MSISGSITFHGQKVDFEAATPSNVTSFPASAGPQSVQSESTQAIDSPYLQTDEYTSQVALEAAQKSKDAGEVSTNLALMALTQSLAQAKSETDRILTLAMQAEADKSQSPADSFANKMLPNNKRSKVE